MNIAISFVSFLAWAWAIISILVIGFKIVSVGLYIGSPQHVADKMRGVTRTYSIERWLVVLIVCAAWIFATWK